MIGAVILKNVSTKGRKNIRGTYTGKTLMWILAAAGL